MEHFLAGIVELGAGAKLQETARVGADDHLSAGAFCQIHFLGQQIHRCASLREVVHAGRAAADVRVRQFHKIELRNSAEEFARSFANLLPVEKMAGILIGDTQRKGM